MLIRDIGRSKLLPLYALPVLIMDYLTGHRRIQSALQSPSKVNRRWCEIPVHAFQ